MRLSCFTSIHRNKYFFFFFNDTATTEIYTLSLHDALPIYRVEIVRGATGLLNGSGDPSATVNFVRKQPRETAGGHTSLTLGRSEEHTSELQSPCNLVCRLLLEKKKNMSIKPGMNCIILLLP